MKRLLALFAILAVSAGSLYLLQRSKRRDAVSPDAVLDATAELERDLSQAPMRLTRLSDQDEIRIGNELAEEYSLAEPAQTAEMRTVENYVSKVGNHLATHAHRQLPYRFHLIADPNLINAFALPGGHVFIGLGLLEQMASEDELACVLGHEIEHIDHYHAVERVQIEAQMKKLDLGEIAFAAQIPLALWQAGYSKEQEFEADREGLRLAVTVGYSPQGIIDLLNRFAELERQYVIRASTPADELSQVAIEGLQGYFRSHPRPEERLAQAKRVIAEDGLDVKKPLSAFAISSLIQTKRPLAGAVKR
jgi:predicted Zn-dependent protease